MNNIVIIGRLVRDPELRTTSTGKSVCNLDVAVDKRIKRDGEQANFFKVTCWGQSAEYASKYGQKGLRVAVKGSMEMESYNDKDGGKKTSWKLNADDVNILDRGHDQESQAGASESPQEEFDPFADE